MDPRLSTKALIRRDVDRLVIFLMSAVKMLKSQSTRSRIISDSSVFGKMRTSIESRRTSVSLKRVTVGDRRFSIATLSSADSIFERMENAMTQLSPTGRRRFRSSTNAKRNQKHLDMFRSLVRSVILLRGCFRMRKKFAVQSGNLTLTHMERSDTSEAYKTSSVSREIRMILSTPAELRREEEVKKVQYYLRASGANSLLAGASAPDEMEKLARHVAYEKYENDRVVAQQGRSPDRFYFILTGKLLIVKEYHIDTGIISKTVGMLTKGMTTDVEEMEQRNLRKESLICRGPVEALVLDRDDYFHIHGERGGAPREFLSRHELFKAFPIGKIRTNRQVVRLQYFPKGAVIFGGGEEFEWLYVIKSGECSLIRIQMVADLKRQKFRMFDKRSLLDLGCDKSRRVKSAAERMAEFRMWKGSPRTPLSNPSRKCFTAPTHKIPASSMRNIEPDSNPAVLAPQRNKSFVGFGVRRDFGVARTSSANMSSRTENEEKPQVTNVGLDDKLPQIRISNSENLLPEQPDSRGNFTNPLKRAVPSLLSKSKLSARPWKTTWDENSVDHQAKRKTITVKSAPPTQRRAYLELRKLRPGDFLSGERFIQGLEDTAEHVEDLPHIRLISDSGSEVVLINRKFFLRHAPTSLLSRISYQISSYPTIETAREAFETQEAWTMYKTNIMRIITTKDTLLPQHDPRPQRQQVPQLRLKSRQNSAPAMGKGLPLQLIPPGTANRSKASRSLPNMTNGPGSTQDKKRRAPITKEIGRRSETAAFRSIPSGIHA